MRLILRVGLVGVIALGWMITFGLPVGTAGLSAQPLLDEKDFPGFTYALDRENIEVGYEKTTAIQTLSYVSNVEQYYLTCASTINRDVTIKFKIGSLTSECENTTTGSAIGEFKFLPISVDLICSGYKPPLKPYLGAGYTLYRYRTFKESDIAFATYEGEHTRGYHFVGGVKYIPNKNVSINAFLNYEMINPFDFNSEYGTSAISGSTLVFYQNAELDLSNISIGLNIALRF